MCEVRTGLWWSANILCDVCDVCADRPEGSAPYRSADMSISPFCLYRSHVINSINVFLSFSPLGFLFFFTFDIFKRTLSLHFALLWGNVMKCVYRFRINRFAFTGDIPRHWN